MDATPSLGDDINYGHKIKDLPRSDDGELDLEAEPVFFVAWNRKKGERECGVCEQNFAAPRGPAFWAQVVYCHPDTEGGQDRGLKTICPECAEKHEGGQGALSELYHIAQLLEPERSWFLQQVYEYLIEAFRRIAGYRMNLAPPDTE